jgi:hypothetical protein
MTCPSLSLTHCLLRLISAAPPGSRSLPPLLRLLGAACKPGITPSELKTVLALLASAALPPALLPALLQSLRSMSERGSGPSQADPPSFFNLGGGPSSISASPPPPFPPAAHFRFACWFRAERFDPDAPAPSLLVFRTASGAGISVDFAVTPAAGHVAAAGVSATVKDEDARTGGRGEGGTAKLEGCVLVPKQW